MSACLSDRPEPGYRNAEHDVSIRDEMTTVNSRTTVIGVHERGWWDSGVGGSWYEWRTEGISWLRGHHAADSAEMKALRVAFALWMVDLAL